MSLSSVFDVFNPALALLHSGLATLAGALPPVLGGAEVAVALVLITCVVRACLLPLAVSVLRAERARRVLAPEVARLRHRHANDPARLAREVQALHRDAGISPCAGLLPALAQAPVLLVLYRLCTLPVIAGAPNVVLSANLFGAPLAAHLPGLMITASLFGSPVLVGVALVIVTGLVAYLTSRQQLHRLQEATAGEIPPLQLMLARVLPFGSVAALAFVPVAVSLYLLTSATWMLAERAVLPRVF
jgi:YidC/Oxa1 family membrane protein insertase